MGAVVAARAALVSRSAAATHPCGAQQREHSRPDALTCTHRTCTLYNLVGRVHGVAPLQSRESHRFPRVRVTAVLGRPSQCGLRPHARSRSRLRRSTRAAVVMGVAAPWERDVCPPVVTLCACCACATRTDARHPLGTPAGIWTAGRIAGSGAPLSRQRWLPVCSPLPCRRPVAIARWLSRVLPQLTAPRAPWRRLWPRPPHRQPLPGRPRQPSTPPRRRSPRPASPPPRPPPCSPPPRSL